MEEILLIKKEIYTLKKELDRTIVSCERISCDELVQLSSRLDKLINKYYELEKVKKTNGTSL